MSAYDREYFEKVASYASLGGYGRMGSIVRKFYRGLLETAQAPRGPGRALDVGCAYGYGCEVLMERGFEPYGLDVSEHAIAEARQSLPSITFAIGSVEDRIPFEQTFDLVVCFEVLEHLAEPLRALLNAKEALTASGVLVAAVPNPASRSPFRVEDPTHVSEHVPEYWRDLFKRAGFEVRRMGAYHFLPLVHRISTRVHFIPTPPWLALDTLIVAMRADSSV